MEFLSLLWTGRNHIQRLYRRRWVLFVIAVVTALAIGANLLNLPAAIGMPPASEIRGVWLTNIDSDVLFDPSRLRQAVATLSRQHFNTLYPTVWNWGYTLYPSAVMQQHIGHDRDSRPIAVGLQGRDMLQELVETGHQKGLAVIPWLEFGFMAPKQSELAQRHPDWWTRQADGSVDGDPKSLDGKQIPIWFNPFRPEVQQLLLDLVNEILVNYDVDGIQLDDHFGMPIAFGYDDYTMALYQQEHGGQRPPNYDPQRCQKLGIKECPEWYAQDPRWSEWLQWRSRKLAQFLQKLHHTVRGHQSPTRPKILLSLSPLDLPYAYEHMLVAWDRWQKAGLIDELIPQIYFSGQKFNDRIDLKTHPELKQARDHLPTAIGILSGLASQPRPIQELRRQVQAVRRQGYAGVSCFFYETLWNKSPEPRALRQWEWRGIFSRSVARSPDRRPQPQPAPK